MIKSVILDISWGVIGECWEISGLEGLSDIRCSSIKYTAIGNAGFYDYEPMG